MKYLKMATLSLAAALALASPASAQVGGKVVQETVEFLLKKFGREAAEEGVEKLAGRLTAAAARHGDDVIAAVRRVGPKALGLADEAGENAPRVMRFLTRHGDDGLRVLSHPQGMALFTRYGDDAAEVLVRHPGVAGPLLDRLGEPAVKALGAVGPQAGRRMGILANDLAGSGRGAELMAVIARYGDSAMEFIWKHKGILAGGAVLTAFLSDPEPYLTGTAEITRVVGENVVKPAVVAAGNVAVEAVSVVRPLIITSVIGLAVLLGLAARSGALKSRPFKLVIRLAGKKAAQTLFRRS
jgi:hypothetical protein